MPAGVPVATVAIGEPGATNAALLAAAILAGKHPPLIDALERFRERQTAEVLAQARSAPAAAPCTIGIVGAGQLGRMLALAGYPARLRLHCVSTAAATRRARRSRRSCGAFTTRASSRACRARRRRHLRLRERAGRSLRARSRRPCRVSRRRARSRSPGPAHRKTPVRALGIPTRRFARRRLARRSARAPSQHRTARRAEDPPPRLRRQGPGRAAPPADVERRLAQLGGRPLLYESFVPFEARGVADRRARPRRRASHLSARGERARDGILRLTRAPYRQRARCSARAERYLRRLLEALRLRRRARASSSSSARPAGRERDGAARPQLRPLDHRRRRDQPVRESPARHARLAARRTRAARPRRHDEPDRQHAAARARCCAIPALHCTTTAKPRARAASSATAPSSTPRPRRERDRGAAKLRDRICNRR